MLDNHLHGCATRSLSLSLYLKARTQTHKHTFNKKEQERTMGGNNLETRSLIDELRPFDKTAGLFDLGHPLLNRVAESFVKAAGVCNLFLLAQISFRKTPVYFSDTLL